MIDAFLAREQSQLLPRIRPGTTHTADFVKATSRCFEWADTLKQRRAELSRDHTLKSDERKRELARMVSDEMLPDLAGVVEPAKRAKGFIAAARKHLPPGCNLDKATTGLFEDTSVVEAAMFFVKREARGIEGVCDSDFDMLTTPGAPS